MGMLKEAEKYGLAALRLTKEHVLLQNSWPYTVQMCNMDLANIYEAMGRHEEAFQYDRSALDASDASTKGGLGQSEEAPVFIESFRRNGCRLLEAGR